MRKNVLQKMGDGDSQEDGPHGRGEQVDDYFVTRFIFFGQVLLIKLVCLKIYFLWSSSLNKLSLFKDFFLLSSSLNKISFFKDFFSLVKFS